jgi:hypothetical protein
MYFLSGPRKRLARKKSNNNNKKAATTREEVVQIIQAGDTYTLEENKTCVARSKNKDAAASVPSTTTQKRITWLHHPPFSSGSDDITMDDRHFVPWKSAVWFIDT